jgi:hypothetical protein
MACPPVNRIHGEAFQWQFEELIDLINIETHPLVVVRSEIHFLG